MKIDYVRSDDEPELKFLEMKKATINEEVLNRFSLFVYISYAIQLIR